MNDEIPHNPGNVFRPVTASSSLTIPMEKFMQMPCQTPTELLDAAKAMLRLYGFNVDDDRTINIKIRPIFSEVEIEVYSEAPF